MRYTKVLDFLILYNFTTGRFPLRGHVSPEISKNHLQPINSARVPQFYIISCPIFVYFISYILIYSF
jgi:hypothetical protein